MTYTASTLSVSGLAAVVLQVWRSFKNRRAMTRLSSLTDAQLKDIGLTRGDLGAARRLPFTADPSAALTELASERYLAAQVDKIASTDIRSSHRLIEANSNSALPDLACCPMAAA
ncbi:DUF1127 domain-containing protein [Roseibium sediminis]|uniref:DUF1127 domain-containing protein n=1 Tax=Roseibium sediminis TaxID=1775174 RepID=UPI0013761509|nr:DUF1127 domain-containing protein [Roseibium sediminis]